MASDHTAHKAQEEDRLLKVQKKRIVLKQNYYIILESYKPLRLLPHAPQVFQQSSQPAITSPVPAYAIAIRKGNENSINDRFNGYHACVCALINMWQE